MADWVRLQECFLKAREGDSLAARETYEAISPILTRFFRTRTKLEQDCEDLTQASLLKIHFARESFKENLSFKTWVFTVANRTLIDHWRGESKRYWESLDEQVTQIKNRELSHDELIEIRENLVNGLEKLKPNDRMLVYLYAVEGLSVKELAKVMGMSESAAKVRAHRNYKKLRELLAQLVSFYLLNGGQFL